MIITSVITTIFTLICAMPLLVMNYFEFSFAIVNSRLKIKTIKKFVILSTKSLYTIPCGIIIGKNFIGEIVDDGDQMKIFASKKFLIENDFLKNENDEDDEDNDDDDKKEESKITFYEREGTYQDFNYYQLKINFKYEPKTNQLEIVNKIINFSKTKSSFSVLISGLPGSGKSMIPLFVSEKIGSYIIDSFNPTDPGDNISKIISDINPQKNKKLIIVLEEVDIIINILHKNLCKNNNKVPIPIATKQDWNKFLDKIDRNIYNNIILIMTSNKSIDHFNELDPSYLREGRLHMSFTLD